MKSPRNENVAIQEYLTPASIVDLLAQCFGKSISKRMLSHVVSITIGESVVAADGYGSKRQFSVQDATLVVAGVALGDLRLSPARVRACIEVIRGEWEEISKLPDFDPKTLNLSGPYYPEKHKYLVAEYIPKSGVLRFNPLEEEPFGEGQEGFWPRLVNGAIVVAMIQSGWAWPRPMIVFPVTWTLINVLRVIDSIKQE